MVAHFLAVGFNSQKQYHLTVGSSILGVQPSCLKVLGVDVNPEKKYIVK